MLSDRSLAVSRVLATLFLVLGLILGTGLATSALAADESADDDAKLSAATLAGLKLRSIGPALMSGRISDVVIDPHHPSTWYVAVGSGNVWKTDNAGTTWTPIFDDQGSYSIGCLALDPNDSNVVWVGTGENVGGRHVGYGDGVYKSVDGGASWQNVGLERSEHIGTILIDPTDSDTVYVAAQGPLWSEGGERGLYKTIDGGASWTRVLGAETHAEHFGPWTGVNDVVMDPRDRKVLYATSHQRFRNVAALVNGGPESGIWKSTDGGETWRELTAGLPSADPTAEVGRIGLAISPQRPDTVYATVELAAREGGFYRSTNAGGSWEKRSDYLSGGTGPHYYQEIFADPHHEGRIYQMDVWLHRSDDDGATFTSVDGEHKHGDNHAMAFHPTDPDYLLVGSDGGLYESFDQAKTWKFFANLPVTQFYKVAVDDSEPFYTVYGGTQDNNTQGGPSRTDNNAGIRNSDWFIVLFGDGHQPATEPGNPDIVYAEWQQGNLVRHDRTTGEIVYIKPQAAPDDPPERFNWDAPILVSPHAPTRLYFASQRVWRSDDRGDSWRAVSGDLTRNEDRLMLPMMGRVQSIDAVWDLWAMSTYNTLTSLSESPVVEGLLYAGSDDGLLHVSEDGGANWRRAAAWPAPIPEHAFVNDVKADLFDADVVYVALDDHKSGDFSPMLLHSDDRGRSWRSIAGDPDDGGLPARHLVWRLVQDDVEPGLLFAGTEFGVFVSLTGGGSWIELQGGVPQIPFRDLAIQRRENDLVGATFGRGFYILDDYTPLRALARAEREARGEADDGGGAEALLAGEAHLFDVDDAWWYLQRRPLGGPKGTQGDGFYTAENPPFGAIFTYTLGESLESRRATRQSREKEQKKAGDDTPYPGWDAMREEKLEDAPAVVVTVRDAAGDVVRRVEGPTGAGLHRIAWDLRLPRTDAWTGPREGGDGFFSAGRLAPPGTYTARLGLRRDGMLREVGEERSFEVVPLHDDTAPTRTATPTESAVFAGRVAELSSSVSSARAVLDELDRRVSLARSAIADAGADPALYAQTVALADTLSSLRAALDGDPLRGSVGEPATPGVSDRLGFLTLGTGFSTYGPTAQQRQVLGWALDAMTEVHQGIEELVDGDLAALEQSLDAAGVPWTPGRGVIAPPAP
ncbi:MAG: glycosyl hydrolase [Acidobacteriota bacterium]